MATNSRMTVRVDRANNRLYCSWEGEIAKADADSFFTDLRFCVADMAPGFSVVNDLRKCHLSYVSAIPSLRRVMQYLVSKGVKDVVRIIDSKNLIYRQFLNLTLWTQGYVPVYVHTLEEADEFLTRPVGREHIRLKLIAKDVSYTVAGQPQAGIIIDVSLGGCAIRGADRIHPAVEQVVQLNFALHDSKTNVCPFELKGMVVRSGSDSFAVQFTDLTETDTKQLAHCLSRESIEGL